MLIEFTIGPDDVFLLTFDLREHVTHRGLGLPVPVQPRDAAGEQLAGLLQLRFLRIHFTDAGLNVGAVFTP